MADYMKKSDVISYIRKEAAEAQSAFEELGGESGIIAEAFEDLANELEDFPAADVAPVVRCKDCQKSGVTEFGKRFCSEPMGAFYGCIPVEDDFFCSGGRRRDGA